MVRYYRSDYTWYINHLGWKQLVREMMEAPKRPSPLYAKDSSDMVRIDLPNPEMRVRMGCVCDFPIFMTVTVLQILITIRGISSLSHTMGISFYLWYSLFCALNIIHCIWGLIKSFDFFNVDIWTINNHLMRSVLILTIDILLITRFAFVSSPTQDLSE